MNKAKNDKGIAETADIGTRVNHAVAYRSAEVPQVYSTQLLDA